MYSESDKLIVCFLIDSLETGGAEKSLASIALGFTNITPVFIHIYKGDSLKGKLISNGIDVYSLDLDKGYHFREVIKKLRPLISQIQPQIIHTTLFKSDIIGRKIIKYYPAKLVSSLVNNSYIKSRYKNQSLLGKVKLFLIQKYDRITARRVDLFISNSKAIKGTNAKALNIEPSKIKVIHRGRNLSTFEDVDLQAINRLKRELGVEGKEVFLNVSRLLQRKGQLDLLEAFKDFWKEYPNTVLLIAGEGEFRKELEHFIINNNLHEAVQLLGNRNDIPVLLKMADLFVFPSWYEGLPGALIEAMMSGTPVLASDIPENLECISKEEAFIFNRGDKKDLLEKLTYAFIHKDERIKKSSLAKKTAIQKFSLDKIVKKYEETYFELLDKE